MAITAFSMPGPRAAAKARAEAEARQSAEAAAKVRADSNARHASEAATKAGAEAIAKKAAELPMFKTVLDSQKAFAQRAVRWDLLVNVDMKIAYDHYFKG
jgi:TRAP-type mannitol/chloroaromatic compound transport system substrate-binding protein